MALYEMDADVEQGWSMIDKTYIGTRHQGFEGSHICIVYLWIWEMLRVEQKYEFQSTPA